jgi:hypothetical protein
MMCQSISRAFGVDRVEQSFFHADPKFGAMDFRRGFGRHVEVET